MFLRGWSPVDRATLASVGLASVIVFPSLGAVGLWDPWETHYAEVAREMLASGDLVHPRWEKWYFFSKPPLGLWAAAAGMVLVTTGRLALGVAGAVVLALLLLRGRPWTLPRTFLAAGSGGALLLALASGVVTSRWPMGDLFVDRGALPLMTEWGVRLPFAMASVASVGLLTWAVARVVSPRVGLLAGVVLCTMPLHFLLARQAVTDPLLVGTTVAGVACAVVAWLDRSLAHPRRWWLGAWACFALATLAKGLLGFLVPAAVYAGVVVLFDARWARLADEWRFAARRARGMGVTVTVTGLAVGLAVAGVASREEVTFISGPSIGGRELLGPAQWLGLTAGLLAAWVAGTVAARRLPPEGDLPPLAAAVLRVVPGRGVLLFLAIALPWYLAMFLFPERDDEGKLFWYRFLVHDHLARFFQGVHTTTPGGTFTYFLEQLGYATFPWVLLVPGAVAAAGRARLDDATPADRLTGIATVWLAVSWLAVGDSQTKFHHYVFPLLPPLAVLVAVHLDELWTSPRRSSALTLVLGGILGLLVAKDLWTSPKIFTDLFVYNADRPWPEHLFTRPVLGFASVKRLLQLGALAGLAAVLGLALASRARAAVRLLTALAAAFAVWFSWSMWVDLSHHWTQRDQFWRYFARRAPGEPIAAFLMNWRGETFYSRNQVVQIPLAGAAAALSRFLALSPRVWILVEHSRLPHLRQLLGDRPVEVVEPELNNKFVLVAVGP